MKLGRWWCGKFLMAQRLNEDGAGCCTSLATNAREESLLNKVRHVRHVRQTTTKPVILLKI